MMATKSGTNQYHGGISVYGRNQDLTAIDYFSKPENGGHRQAAIQPLSVRRARSAARSSRTGRGSSDRSSARRRNTRSSALTASCASIEYLVPLNIGLKLTDTIPQPSKDLMTQGKVNLQLGRPHAAYVRWATQHGFVDNDFIGNTAAMLDYAPYMDHNEQNLWNLAGGWTWIINPSTVNQVTAQFITWTHDQDYPACPIAQPGGCLYQRLTFPSVSAGPIHAFPKWYNFEDKYQIKDDFSKQIGRHSLKTGGDLSLLPVYGGIFGGGSPGAINFFHDPSVIATNSNGLYPRGFQTPGIVRSITVFSDPIGDYGSDGNWNFGGYLQDDYRVSSNVTLNLGLRYDIYEYMNQPNLAAQSHLPGAPGDRQPVRRDPADGQEQLLAASRPRLGSQGRRDERGARQLRPVLRDADQEHVLPAQLHREGHRLHQPDHREFGDWFGAARELHLRRDADRVGRADAGEPDELPDRRQQHGLLVRSEHQGCADAQVARGLLARPRAEHSHLRRLPTRRAPEWLAEPEYQPAG